MQITINLKVILEKLRYILLGLILLLTFIFRESTLSPTSNELVVDDETPVEEGTTNTEQPLENSSEAIAIDSNNDPVPTSNMFDEHVVKEKAVVLQVIEGDTVKVQFGGNRIETIRMLLIDTPKSVQEGTPVQPYALQASQRAKELMIKDTVVEVEVGEEQYDSHGSLLAHIWVDEQNINLQLVAEGFARVAYVAPPNTQYVEAFYEAQELAKSKQLNIWRVDGYVQEDGYHAEYIK